MKKTNKNTKLTPEQYIRQKARTLPLGQCYMNKNWFISGMAIAVVCRCHKMGTYTFGVFQFDTFCAGLIDCKVEFSRDKVSYTNFLAYLKEEFKIEPVTYQEAHNLIFGGVAFGEDAGFTPSPMFNLAKFVLEEDTEDIPLINYQFGRFGKHFLLADNEQELDEYMPHLIAHLGKENVLFSINGSDRYFNGEDFYDSETRKVMRQIVQKIRHQEDMPLEVYSYVHPEYAAELKVKHEMVRELLFNPANRMSLTDEQIDSLLALPHDELREDLHQVLSYEMGQTCDHIPVTDVSTMHSAVVHALILLKQLGYAESLPLVLETLKQQKKFYDYHMGIIFNETYVPTLYNLGKDQLDKLYEFLQIPGLYTYARYLILPTVLQVAEKEPERKAEVVEWFRKVLNFYTDNIADNHCCDGSLAGLLIADLMKLQAEELLPEVKALFETGKVNVQCCGDYNNFEEMIKRPHAFTIQYQFEAHEHYAELRQNRDQFILSHNQILEDLNNQAEEVEETTQVETAEDAEPAKVVAAEEADVIEEAEVIEEVVEEKTEPAVSEPAEETSTNDDAEKAAEVPAKKKRATTKKATATKKAATAEEVTEKKPKATRKTAAKKDAEAKEDGTTVKKATTKKASTKKATTKKTDADKEADAAKATTKKKATATTKKTATKKASTVKKETEEK